MKLIRLYIRVLELLGREARLGWALAVANLALASAMFVEPVLFGRIVDTLASAQARMSQLAGRDLMMLVGAWVGFGLFIIVCSTLVALHADRLAHRQYQVVRTMFFEHVLQLPLSYYTGSHSGRLVKVMMTGTQTLWSLWLSFFREHFARFLSLIVLLPLTMLSILVLGVWFYLRGQTTVGEIVMFMSFAALLISRLEQAVHFANEIVMDAPRIAEFFEVLDTEPAVRDRPDAVDPDRMQGLVEFKDVSFSYDGKRPAVADLTFAALPGETVALVGATGAGKSTALALLHRAFDPQSGIVRIDGRDIRALTLAGLRRNIGVVFQEVLLFNRSIAENLRVGKPDATDDELRAACERAQVLDVIERLPQGFDTNAGERGGRFSGAERQRLSIARARLKDRPILILDEATSALDALTEARVQAALAEVMKARTTFVIAHRLATVRNAHRILVFAGGRIIETGTFDELMRRGGHFAELARSQFLAGEVAKKRHEPMSGEPVET